jgi:cell division protein FtsZ
LGVNEGLGAGANPDVGQQSAIVSADRKMLDRNTKIWFYLLQGMGGGTGTGAAQCAQCKEEILTVGI